MAFIKQARDIEYICLFAPQNCTGASGMIGDTVLQTSLVRTLLDRSLFPSLKRVYWWGAASILNSLFPDLKRHVVFETWDGGVDTMPDLGELAAQNVDAILVASRDHRVIERLRSYEHRIACYYPAQPLHPQSNVHLTRQMHTCLVELGIDVENPPQPRIIVLKEQVIDACRGIDAIGVVGKSKGSEYNVDVVDYVSGKMTFDPEVDRVFLVNPGVGGRNDERTWPIEAWQEMVRLLSNVGLVIVSYNPGKSSERLAAQSIIFGRTNEPAFKPRFAVGLNLEQLARWACASNACIVPDSGPMHVVSASICLNVRPRVLGLIGTMSPSTWKPLGENFEAMGQWPLPLSNSLSPHDVVVRAAGLPTQRACTAFHAT